MAGRIARGLKIRQTAESSEELIGYSMPHPLNTHLNCAWPLPRGSGFWAWGPEWPIDASDPTCGALISGKWEIHVEIHVDEDVLRPRTTVRCTNTNCSQKRAPHGFALGPRVNAEGLSNWFIGRYSLVSMAGAGQARGRQDLIWKGILGYSRVRSGGDGSCAGWSSR